MEDTRHHVVDFLRGEDGRQLVKCPRCAGTSPVSADRCKGCGLPFRAEGATPGPARASNGFSVASLALGIIGLPMACAVIPSALAVVFGITGYIRATQRGEGGVGKGIAIAGIVCGSIGCLIACMFMFA